MDILSDLRRVYREEWWHTVIISDEALDKYHTRLLTQGNIFYLWDKELIAYIEYWRITQSQLDMILKDSEWSAYNEDIMSGDICFVANIWLHPDYRGDKFTKRTLKSMLLNRNRTCSKFVWKRNRKGKPTKLFTRSRYGVK